MEISATFFVGLSGGRWEHAGPYMACGRNVEDAASEALALCACDYAKREVMFTTIASINLVDGSGCDPVRSSR